MMKNKQTNITQVLSYILELANKYKFYNNGIDPDLYKIFGKMKLQKSHYLFPVGDYKKGLSEKEIFTEAEKNKLIFPEIGPALLLVLKEIKEGFYEKKQTYKVKLFKHKGEIQKLVCIRDCIGRFYLYHDSYYNPENTSELYEFFCYSTTMPICSN